MRDPIPFHDLKSSNYKLLHNTYKIRKDLADFLSGIKFNKRTDLLDNHTLIENVTDLELLSLLRPSRLTPDPHLNELIKFVVANTYKGFILSVRELEDGIRRASIEDGTGEIISAEINQENKSQIKFSSIRLFGKDLSTLMILEKVDRINGMNHLDNLRKSKVASLWLEKDLTVPQEVNPIIFKTLSAFLSNILHLTRPTSEGSPLEENGTLADGPAGIAPDPIETPGSGENPENDEAQCGPGSGWLADLVPELNVTDCCKAHDACYAKGCTSCDKAKCDTDFYKCILPKAGPAIATLYYDAVTAFGQSSFNYCDGKWGLGGTVSVAVGVGVGVIVGFIGGPGAGIVAGMIATVASIAINSQLCKICEEAKKWECTAWKENRYKKCAEKREKRKKKCRKWKKWLRWLCRAWTYVSYWICKAWTWIVHKLCVAGKWVITKLTC